MRAEYDFSTMKARKNPYASKLKKPVTMRLSEEVVLYFKNMALEAGVPYQSLIDLYLRDEMTPKEREAWLGSFASEPRPFSAEERSQWLAGLKGMSLSSDAFIPFRDSIDRAAAVGVGYVAQTGGSIRDGEVAEAANEYGLLMTCTGVRLFTH